MKHQMCFYYNLSKKVLHIYKQKNLPMFKHQIKSSGVNFPKCLNLSSDLLLNSFPTTAKSIWSVSFLWKFRIANELKRFCDIVDRCQVLSLRAKENVLSGVALVAGFTSRRLKITMIFGISLLSSTNV